MPFTFPLTDAHVHPDFSIDAKGTVTEYCDRALEIGLSEIIFATHVDTDPMFPDENVMVIDGERVPTSVDAIKRYADVVWRAKEKFYDLGLYVKCGVEVGFHTGLDDKLLKTLDDTLFEYVLVGIHRIDGFKTGLMDEAQELYETHSVLDILERYYATVKLAASYDIFEAVAHLDYYRRYAPKDKLQEVMRVDFDFIAETLDVLADAGLAIEVNTSAIRHGQKEYYPSMALLNLARKAGVPIRYLGSDAHRPDQLATDFENAELIVYETNLYDISEG
jgi:histidinol-phosphatase (PHP family)